ncbi:Ribosome-associated heat shock protein implicated in the recycling of the 50S subunit (S4 paralog) [Hahella chejuensis KCTC 2396]|uniref:Heat shock protein 15 n=1 Tax=Hahella chejuensis (strain KCTC 2396) TaxID=349521 RepID=Q2SPF7_HAHCH|nr:ribosome-associated heat shock protein Hsp15 [Hahella chejuensis]ABC27467.1 Ribosome-associated heat shock protein implicated in the recycling of the 50S subunit (S4 paralog) [Hahella chejuensis KCTC 2396]
MKGQASATEHKVRLDKWLWAARFYKTRTLAKEAIEGGRVHYNGARVKPGRVVEAGAEVTLKQGWSEKTVLVLDISEKRGPAPVAQKLYQETEASVEKREQLAWQQKQIQAAQLPPARRPTKKQRRMIHRFKEQAEHD